MYTGNLNKRKQGASKKFVCGSQEMCTSVLKKCVHVASKNVYIQPQEMRTGDLMRYVMEGFSGTPKDRGQALSHNAEAWKP